MKKGKIVAFAARKGWGYIYSDGENVFFHVANSPGFAPALDLEVEFETAPPFKLGQRDQAVNLQKVESAGVKAGA